MELGQLTYVRFVYFIMQNLKIKDVLELNLGFGFFVTKLLHLKK